MPRFFSWKKTLMLSLRSWYPVCGSITTCGIWVSSCRNSRVPPVGPSTRTISLDIDGLDPLKGLLDCGSLVQSPLLSEVEGLGYPGHEGGRQDHRSIHRPRALHLNGPRTRIFHLRAPDQAAPETHRACRHQTCPPCERCVALSVYLPSPAGLHHAH